MALKLWVKTSEVMYNLRGVSEIKYFIVIKLWYILQSLRDALNLKFIIVKIGLVIIFPVERKYRMKI